MICKRYFAYVFIDNDDVKFFREADLLRRTRAVHVQINSIPASVEEEWDLSFAGMDSFVAVGYFAMREVEVKHWSCQELEDLHMCAAFLACSSKILGCCLRSLQA